MINREMQIEIDAKKTLAIKDFELLSTPGILGSYQECELTHIYLIETNTKKLFHYYALLSYEEYYEADDKLRNIFLTPELLSINKNYKLGIKQMRISFDYARDIFNQLYMNNLIIDGITFGFSKFMTVLPKTHIPSLWEGDSPLLQSILKPNYWGDSYIIEFFSNQNPLGEILIDNDFMNINTEIKKNISIDLESIHDRIGSFIFQFPITFIEANLKPTNDWCNAKYTIKTYPPFDYNNNLTSLISTDLDNLMTSCNIIEGICEDYYVELGDSHNFELLVINKHNKLVYRYFRGNYFRYFNIDGNIGIHNSEPRIFKNSDNEEIRVDLFSNDFSVGNSSNRNYDERILRRIRNNDNIKMNSNFAIFNDQRKEAMSYLRELIHKNSSNSSEIWILDPYLQSKDILDTLYYPSLLGIKLKCIASYQKIKRLFGYIAKSENNPSSLKKCFSNFFKKKKHNLEDYYFEKYKLEQKEYFFSNSNNLGIILEYRIKHDMVGFDFHDRFLFFIPKDGEALPKVYSLGTSVNSFGKAYHMVQQLSDPRSVVHVFQELWKQLDNEADRIIKLPEEKSNEK
jgi:hypothetical protein